MISPSFADGVLINAVQEGGPAASAEPRAPIADNNPVITQMQGQDVSNTEDYYTILRAVEPNTTVSIQTATGDTYFVTPTLQNGVASLGLTVGNRPTTAIKKGLDLEGGTRVILEPERPVNQTETELILSNIEQRINALGLSDSTVRSAQDLDGSEFYIVEVPGVNAEEVTNLLRRQGTFEARIGNETVFTGGDDITYVCQTSDCSGLVRNGCQETPTGWSCQHQFTIRISAEAAERQAQITETLDNLGGSLSENITFFIDDTQVQSLTISSSLQGQEVEQLSISGTGEGQTQSQAQQASLDEMRSTQAILQTGSLPVKLNIVKTDTISPQLGSEFLQSAIQAGLLAIFVVALIVFMKYRTWKVSLPMVFIMFSEVTLLLGIFALLGTAAGFRIDMAAVAAVVVAIGSSVDDQIVIADEALGRKKKDWDRRLKKAFFIIMAAYVTLLVAMLPLLVAGAGLLRGFAITTILGVTIGVFVTRPAYAQMLQVLLDEEV